MPMQITPELQEAMRRRVGQQPSFAGVPGGAPQANQPVPTNPLMQQGTMSRGGMASLTGSSSPQTASQPGTQQLAKSAPGEAELIIKALSDRLKRLA